MQDAIAQTESAFLSLETAAAIVVVLTALAAWINERFIHLPRAIGTMLAGLLVAAIAMVIDWADIGQFDIATYGAHHYNFSQIVLNLLLPFILFAAAMQIDLSGLAKSGPGIAYLSTIGVVIFVGIWGTLIWLVMNMIDRHIGPDIGISFPAAILFATMMASTDAAAVLSTMRHTVLPRQVRTLIAGESLFNDAVSIVLFLTVLTFIASGHEVNAADAAWVLGKEIIGGLLIGFGGGLIGSYMLNTCKGYSTQVLVTVGVVLGGSVLANAPMINASSPLAMVVAGIVIARCRVYVEAGEQHPLVMFWRFTDNAMNGILFLLIGLELLVIADKFHWSMVCTAVICFPLLLIARYLSLFLPWTFFSKTIFRRRLTHVDLGLLTWCGLRGGIAIALAFRIPENLENGDLRDTFIVGAFVIVLLSMLVQGLSTSAIARRLSRTVVAAEKAAGQDAI
ncbi:MAG: cation:proton antiporter [Pirellulales bacterium]|nr:cation:proton antiporter [Pirellulales bacterium]HJN64963.1 cation:proton antiporter [Pirellulales bacterium]